MGAQIKTPMPIQILLNYIYQYIPFKCYTNFSTVALTKVTLKLFLNSSGTKVIFAEAGKDFVDFLVSTLALPVGKVFSILSGKQMVCSLGNLYNSVNSFSSTHMLPNQTMYSLLKSQSPISSLLPKQTSFATTTTTKTTVYKCSTNKNMRKHLFHCSEYVADDPRCNCPNCGSPMHTEGNSVPVRLPSSFAGDQEGYVKGAVSYMVMDDLEVKPLSAIAVINLMNQYRYNANDSESMEQNVVVGIEQGIELLRVCLQSKTVLTDVLLPKK